MAEFKEIMKIRKRMCDNLRCKECPLSNSNNDTSFDCTNYIINCLDEAEQIILKWAKEHPTKTNSDKLKEVFGYDFDFKGCLGFKCPTKDGKCVGCDNCKFNEFWETKYKTPEEQK